MKMFHFFGTIRPTPSGPNERFLGGKGGGMVWTDSEVLVEDIMREYFLVHGWTIVAREIIFEVSLEFAKSDPSYPSYYEAYLEAQRTGVSVCFRGLEITEEDIVRELEIFGPGVVERYRLKRKGLLPPDAPILPPDHKVFFSSLPMNFTDQVTFDL